MTLGRTIKTEAAEFQRRRNERNGDMTSEHEEAAPATVGDEEK